MIDNHKFEKVTEFSSLQSIINLTVGGKIDIINFFYMLVRETAVNINTRMLYTFIKIHKDKQNC